VAGRGGSTGFFSKPVHGRERSDEAETTAGPAASEFLDSTVEVAAGLRRASNGELTTSGQLQPEAGDTVQASEPAASGSGQQSCPSSLCAFSSAGAGDDEQQQSQQMAGAAAKKNASTRPMAPRMERVVIF
jgi:hypothetical protein